MTPQPESRGQWSGRLGFVLAAAGSAIGLGNIWRFPTSVAQSGGGLFVLVYLVFVFAIGVPVLMAELAIGRETKKNPVGAFRKLAPSTWWASLGWLGVVTSVAIFAYYSVIAGWTLGYLVRSFSGEFGSPISAAESGVVFSELIGSPRQALILTGLFMLLTVVVVRGGVSKGIERTTKVLMPLLFVLLILLAVRAMTLPGGMSGVAFMFQPDWSELSVSVVMNALGQAFFSLGLGMGVMITYGSYFPANENIATAGATVAILDTAIAILAGLIIFPALFAAGVGMNAGPGLVFVVLPTVFGTLPGGAVLSIAFYALLVIAALTSTISMLEISVAYFTDEWKWSRAKAATVLGGLAFVLAVPSALSSGGSAFFTNFAGGGWLAMQNIIWGNYSLSIGAFGLCVFVGTKWGVPKFVEALESSGHRLSAKGTLGIFIKYVCPLAIAMTLILMAVTGSYL